MSLPNHLATLCIVLFTVAATLEASAGAWLLAAIYASAVVMWWAVLHMGVATEKLHARTGGLRELLRERRS